MRYGCVITKPLSTRDHRAEPVCLEASTFSIWKSKWVFLVETAKANGVEPHAYLTHLFTQLPNAKTVEDFEALLPWNVKAALAKAELQQSERGKDALT